MGTPRPLAPATDLLAGYFRVFDEEYDSGDIDTGHRIVHHDGRSTFLVEFMEDDSLVEVRLESKDGRRYRGTMWSVDWDVEYNVQMKLWVSPERDRQWMLLGSWEDPEEGAIDWAITLFPDPNLESGLDDDDDDDDIS